MICKKYIDLFISAKNYLESGKRPQAAITLLSTQLILRWLLPNKTASDTLKQQLETIMTLLNVSLILIAQRLECNSSEFQPLYAIKSV